MQGSPSQNDSSACSFGPLILLILLHLAVREPVAHAQNSAPASEKTYQQSIGAIGKQIKSISRNLNANKALLKSERDQLFKTEREIAKLNKSIEETNYQLAKNEHELDAVNIRIQRLSEAQESNRLALRKLLVVRYQNGKPDYLKSLLNQENPYAVGRLVNYHNYFSSALKAKYTELSRLASEAESLQRRQRVAIAALSEDKQKQKALRAKQEASKKKRAATIAKLDKKVASNTQQLDRLNKDRARLRSLVKQLEKQAAELKRIEEKRAKDRARELAKQNKPSPAPVRKLVKGGFTKQKGRLQFPVRGVAKRKFGGRLPESGMRAEGHFFATNGSVAVKSIFRGRVLFADFLKGYGQLIIIDHGDDHISLYGHNDRVLKRVGEMVETNEIIAKSGVTGGLKSPGLYFEIRKNATPVDPAKWCQ